jgi:hypothetical protein
VVDWKEGCALTASHPKIHAASLFLLPTVVSKFYKEEFKMKLKKVLVVILSVAMIVTLMPAAAFASSTNSVNDTISVSKDDPIPANSIDIEARNSWVESTETLTVTFHNAEWTVGKDNVGYSSSSGGGIVVKNGTSDYATGYSLLYVTFDDDDKGPVTATITDARRIKKGSIVIDVSFSGKVEKNDVLTLHFNDGALKANGSNEEDVTVTIESDFSDISGGDYTIATISDGGTTTNVSGTVKTFGRISNKKAAEIRMKEDAVNSIESGSLHVLKFALPKGVTWNTDTPMNITGNLFRNSGNGAGDVTLHNVGDDVTAATLIESGAGAFSLTNENRTLNIVMQSISPNTSRSTGYFEPIVNIGKKAVEGDIAVSIVDAKKDFGNKVSSVNGLVIARYGQENVEVFTFDDVPTIVAGQIQDTDDEYFWTGIVFDENVAGSLSTNKDIDITLPEDVQIVTEAVAEKLNFSGGGIHISTDDDDTLSDAADADTPSSENLSGDEVFVWDDGWEIKDDTSTFTFNIESLFDDGNVGTGGSDWDTTDTNTLIIYMPVSVKPDFTGDITATVEGKDFETAELVIGTVVAPLTISATTTDVAVGSRTQALSTITLSETEPGYVGRYNNQDKIILELDTSDLGGFSFDNASVEVTEGDLEVSSDLTYDNEYVIIKVKNDSTEASTIEITGLEINLARWLPEGVYNLGIVSYDRHSSKYKTAVVDNYDLDGGDFGADKDVYVDTTPFVNITTPPEGGEQPIVTSKFVIGETTYSVDGTEYEMDVAPYIDGNNRTMLPIRFVANALGITDDNITYAGTTATISGLNTVVTVTTGSQILGCSSGNITMDTVAVNSNNRLYVPVRFIAQALGAEVDWDQATQTVTITR